ncbi:MAG TPA: pirin family protein [Stellaceae bacterium]|nr:pirin family protein [Stellaceae bacterium]
MIVIRPREKRGKTQLGWLDSRHTFAFGDYADPEHRGFRALRVINEDRVIPGAGFPTHAHRDMEIVTYVLEGAVEHKDSLGNGSVIKPGEVQRMSAGTGIRHSEYNPSRTAGVHFLQIWILPEKEGIAPGYEQRDFPAAEKRGRWRLVASRDGREDSVTVHQDADVYATLLGEADKLRFTLRAGRYAWLQVARGQMTLGDGAMKEGDGAAIVREAAIDIAAAAESELLLFDLA